MVLNENPIKALLISNLPPPASGIGSWTKRYLEWAETSHNLKAEVVNTAVIGNRAINITAGRTLLEEVNRTVKILRDLQHKLLAYQPNIVHLNSPCARFGIMRDYLCALMVKKRGIPIVIHFHCSIEDQVNGNKVQLYFLKKLVNIADELLVLNTPSRQFLKKTTDSESILVANYIGARYMINQPKSISPEIKTVLFVGHVIKTKGIMELISAAQHLAEIDFILAGPVSPQISVLSIPANIKLLGQVDESVVREVLDEADVFLFPSYTEGFAVALLEAMARGLPVIATPVGANRDMLEEHGGVLVRVGSVEDIVNAVNDLAPVNRREAMSHWNVKKVAAKYTINNVMNDLIGVYRDVIHARQGG